MAGKKFEAGLAGGIIEAGFEVPGPKKYQPKKSLKDLLREDRRPENEIYRKALELWPGITDAQVRELLSIDRERLTKVVRLCELTGKNLTFFEEFLSPSLDYELHLQLDVIYRYWSFVLPRIQALLDLIDEKLCAEWFYDINGEKFRGKLALFLDNKQVPLELYERLGKPVIGSLYGFWPCAEAVRSRIRAAQEAITSLLETQVDLTARALELNTLIERFRELQNSFFRLDPLSGVNFPPKFAKTIGHIKKKIIYGNVFTLGCAWCPPRKHEIVQIIILEPRKGEGEGHG
ncbi:MAG: hypothetical protein QXX29_05145 [Nitrososphaerota archaeon]